MIGHRHFGKTLAVVIVASALMWMPTSASVVPPSVIIPPSQAELLTGQTYGEWSAAWWKYYLEIPAENNPGFDDTGANCGYQQSGSVFFLMGTSGGSITRTECVVPQGKALFFPLVTIWWYQSGNQDERGLTGFLQSASRSTHDLHASIDGIDVGTIVSLNPKDSPLRAVSPEGFFSVVLPENNAAGLAPGEYPRTAADGFYLMVAPLSVGQHTLRFGGSSAGFATDTTYILRVQ